MTLKLVISTATSVVTLFAMWVIGAKKWYGWAMGLANQALWVTFAVLFKAWGLLPLTAALIVVYSRNLLAWRTAVSETPQ